MKYAERIAKERRDLQVCVRPVRQLSVIRVKKLARQHLTLQHIHQYHLLAKLCDMLGPEMLPICMVSSD